MKKISLNEGKPYAATGHFGTTSLRIIGKDETGAQRFWVGLSYFLPAGGVAYCGEDQVNEKVYIVLDGEVTVKSKTQEYVLRAMDSLYISPGEGRSIINNTHKPASMLVIANY